MSDAFISLMSNIKEIWLSLIELDSSLMLTMEELGTTDMERDIIQSLESSSKGRRNALKMICIRNFIYRFLKVSVAISTTMTQVITSIKMVVNQSKLMPMKCTAHQ